MKREVKMDADRCPQDHPCPLVRICPVGAISQEGFAAPEINHEKCISCGKCVATCPYQVPSFEQ
ncbi:MAG: 4Fe-4S binding protein [Candidatus Moranbacteria bacterium]|nr:4Fe-4S binding protein [Candidatus Moranbacteria bacterium]